jgi:hypothetical protein
MVQRQPGLKLLPLLLVAVLSSVALAQYDYDGYDTYGYDFYDMGAGGEQLGQSKPRVVHDASMGPRSWPWACMMAWDAIVVDPGSLFKRRGD